MGFNLNWFLGALAIQLWLAPYVLMFWPEIRDAWRQWRTERQMERLAARHAMHAQPVSARVAGVALAALPGGAKPHLQR